MQAVYIHGLESSSRGTKARFFRERFPDMVIGDYTGDMVNRMRQLEEHLQGLKDLLLVGSSFGGLMASIFTLLHPDRVNRLVLLAPALNFPGLEPFGARKVTAPTFLYVGRHDTVTPAAEVEPVARRLFAYLSWHLVDDDHLLHRTFPDIDWQELLTGEIGK